MAKKILEADCLAIARKQKQCVFKASGGELTLCFENATTIVRLEHSFFGRWAWCDVPDEALARDWAARGWLPLGPRVAWRLAGDVLTFRTADGSIYLLTKQDAFAWLKGEAGVPSLHWSPLSESRNAPPITERHEVTIWQRSEDRAIKCGADSAPIEKEEA